MNEVLYEFELDKKYINEYPLETTEGTKKMIKNYHINAINSRNAYINNKIEKYNSLKEIIYELLKERVNNLIPKDTSDNYKDINNQINTYKNIIKYNNEYNDIYEKLDLDKIINNMGDIDLSNLSEVNVLISQTINIFSNANVHLTINDFDYTMYTKEYMQVYFSNVNTEAFDDIMKEIFDKLYWECPNIVTHLKLALRNLYNKYKKQLEIYFQNIKKQIFVNNNTDQSTYYNTYINLSKQLDDIKSKDSYLLSYKFLNNEISVYDYFSDTPQFRKNYNRFLFDQDFNNLEEKEQIAFYQEIKNLKYVVEELKKYNQYKDFIKDIIDRYKQKDTYKNIYPNKQKEIEKEEKIRQSLYKQYYQKSKKFLFFSKKADKELLKVQMNNQIKKLDNLYQELDNDKINHIIMNEFNDTSTLYDALTLLISYYSYFKKLYSKINKDGKNIDYLNEYDALFNYIYDADNTFIKKIKFIDDIDINDIIYEKYKLLNINISKDDLTDNLQQLENSIDFINLINNIKQSNISLNDIKFIIDFKKIDKN